MELKLNSQSLLQVGNSGTQTIKGNGDIEGNLNPDDITLDETQSKRYTDPKKLQNPGDFAVTLKGQDREGRYVFIVTYIAADNSVRTITTTDPNSFYDLDSYDPNKPNGPRVIM